jgi:hypothetical protein
MVEIKHPLSHMYSWRSASLVKHRDNFTFTFLFVTLCFSRITMPKETYGWKVTKCTHEKNSLNRKLAIVSARLLHNCLQRCRTSIENSLQIE